MHSKLFSCLICPMRTIGPSVDTRSCVSLWRWEFYTFFLRGNGPRIPRCWWLWSRLSLCNDWCPSSLLLSVHSFFLAAEAVAALVVDNGGMFITGFAGVHLELYSLWLSSGPRCSTSWSVWTRRTGLQWASFGDDATRVVFPYTRTTHTHTNNTHNKNAQQHNNNTQQHTDTHTNTTQHTPLTHTTTHHTSHITHHTPHHTTPHHTSHHITPHHTTPHHNTTQHTIPQHTTPHHTTPHHTTPHHTTPHHHHPTSHVCA